MKEKETSIIITREFRNAIIELINYEYNKKNIRLAEKIKVSPSTVGKWINPEKTAQIKTPLYKIVFQMVKKYLDNPQHDHVNTPKQTSDCEHICEKLTPWEKNLLKKYANIADDEREKIYESFKKLINSSEEKHAQSDDAQKKDTGTSTDVPGAGHGHKHKHFEELHDKAV